MNAAKTIGAIGLCALLLVFMSGCIKGGDQEMPGGKKSTNIRTPTVSEKDGLIKHFYLETLGSTEFIDGHVELHIDRFDPKDSSIVKRAGENTNPFEEEGYIFYMSSTRDECVFPVNKNYMEKLTKMVSESRLYTYSGTASWTSGLPEDAGISMLSVEYESGNTLSHSENGTIPLVAQDMIERMYPLLVETMEANGTSFISLSNIYHAIATPTEWIHGVSMGMWSEGGAELFFYHVIFDDSSFHYLNDEGIPCKDSVIIEKEDAQTLLRLLSESRFFYKPFHAEIDEYDDFSYLVDFRSGSKNSSVTKRYGAQFHFSTDEDIREELHLFFFHLINKYFRSEEG